MTFELPRPNFDVLSATCSLLGRPYEDTPEGRDERLDWMKHLLQMAKEVERLRTQPESSADRRWVEQSYARYLEERKKQKLSSRVGRVLSNPTSLIKELSRVINREEKALELLSQAGQE